MLASKSLEHVLQQVQISSLNYQVQITPFSAFISLRKSFIKDKSGIPVTPPTSAWAPSHEHGKIESLLLKNEKLEKNTFLLQQNYEEALKERDTAKKAVETLESELSLKTEIKPFIINSVTEAAEVELNELREKVKDLQNKIEVRDDNIKDLEHANKIAKEVTDALHKKLKEAKIKYNKEKTEILKDHKAEVKALKKELGETNKENIKLKKKVEKFTNEDLPKPESSPSIFPPPDPDLQESLKDSEPQTLCSICSVPILDFKPRYFLGEMINPACNDCNDDFEGDNSGPDPDGWKHTPVCVTRQPHPPPYPSITHLVNEVTKYHEHMMSRAGVPGRYPGCERCMNAYSKNYGCEGCVWLKWHGELHGYPDIHPSDYKMHLDPTVWEDMRSRL